MSSLIRLNRRLHFTKFFPNMSEDDTNSNVLATIMDDDNDDNDDDVVNGDNMVDDTARIRARLAAMSTVEKETPTAAKPTVTEPEILPIGPCWADTCDNDSDTEAGVTYNVDSYEVHPAKQHCFHCRLATDSHSFWRSAVFELSLIRESRRYRSHTIATVAVQECIPRPERNLFTIFPPDQKKLASATTLSNGVLNLYISETTLAQ